ncbi:DUF885 domain-containing protein [Caulobacter sp. 602-2]|uniref:DUF885 domain-containing protein n=1 Tax=Caulobacter sp. 602-2 TaxID=2710887 RepID=A0A6G4R0G1_9CAUL|nr:DUF885 domain-containing protein [Caulobacter sp. 602-2]NGM51261.1 DUF885 domain-containing protein [Caulobacter sp. 602-2]
MIDRRAMMLLTGASLAAGPALAAQEGDAALKVLLDGFAKGGTAADRLTALSALDPQTLSPKARLDYDAVRIAAAAEADLVRRFPFGAGAAGPYVVTTRSGAWQKASEAWGDAAPAMVARIQAETDRIRKDADAGVVPPAFLIDRLDKALVEARSKASPSVGGALNGQRAALLALKPRAGTAAGVRFKDREAYYAAMLKTQLGAPMAPVEARRRLDDAIKSLHARADALLRAQGLSQGGVGERLRALMADERYLYSDDDAGRDRAIADMAPWLAKARARLSQAFGDLPGAVDAVSVRRMSPADEAAGRQGYRDLPSADGKKPGAYYVDLKRIRDRPSWSLPAVVHHEVLPGHMLQIPKEELSGAHPYRSRVACPAAMEGWAVYAEHLAWEMGAFEGQPLAEIGGLYWILFRAARARMDIGIHLEGWTPERAMAFLADVQGAPVIFAPFAQEVERAAIAPGAAAGQGMYWLELARLRRAWGGTLREFHGRVLDRGTLPLAMLAPR